MKKTIITAVAATLTLTASATFAADAGKAVVVPAGEIKWVDTPGMPAVKTATLDGDAAKGPHHALTKLAAGFSVPLHMHNADYYGFVISGTFLQTVDGKEYKLGPGSYFSYTGKKKHVTTCAMGADCVLAMDVRGAWDVVPDAPPKDAAKPVAKEATKPAAKEAVKPAEPAKK